GRRIGLGDDRWADRILLARRGGLVGKLDHLRRLHFEPAATDPVLRLRDRRLHLPLPLTPRLVQLRKPFARNPGRLLVVTVYPDSELVQEAATCDLEPSQLAAQREEACRRAAPRGERVRRHPRPIAEDASFDADEEQEDAD